MNGRLGKVRIGNKSMSSVIECYRFSLVFLDSDWFCMSGSSQSMKQIFGAINYWWLNRYITVNYCSKYQSTIGQKITELYIFLVKANSLKLELAMTIFDLIWLSYVFSSVSFTLLQWRLKMSKKKRYILRISQKKNPTPYTYRKKYFNIFVSAFLSVPGIFTFLPSYLLWHPANDALFSSAVIGSLTPLSSRLCLVSRWLWPWLPLSDSENSP